MKKFFLLWTLFIWCCSASAGSNLTYIYKHRIFLQRVGNGAPTTNIITGWLVTGMVENRIFLIAADKVQKKFSINETLDFDLDQVYLRISRRQNPISTVALKIKDGNFSGITAKGRDRLTYYGRHHYRFISHHMVVGGFQSWVNTNGTTLLDSYRGYFSYDRVNTDQAFVIGETGIQAVERLKTQLIDAGYSEGLVSPRDLYAPVTP